MAIYTVFNTATGKTRLVSAPSAAVALRYVAKDLLKIDTVRSAPDLATALSAGYGIEDAYKVAHSEPEQPEQSDALTLPLPLPEAA
jgi:hypothetical protein